MQLSSGLFPAKESVSTMHVHSGIRNGKHQFHGVDMTYKTGFVQTIIGKR